MHGADHPHLRPSRPTSRTQPEPHRSAGQRTFSLILHVTERDAGIGRRRSGQEPASSCAPPARRPQQPAPPRRSRARPPDGSGPPGDPGLMSAPARDHPGSAACGRRPATREPGRNADQGHRRHPDRPDRIPAARTLHRDRDQLHRQGLQTPCGVQAGRGGASAVTPPRKTLLAGRSGLFHADDDA